MLISTYSIVALRCAQCGKMELASLSRFCCGKSGQKEFFCECGHRLLTLVRKGSNLYDLQVKCVLCEVQHTFQLTGQEIWHQHVRPLTCASTGLELGYLGRREEVRLAVQQGERMESMP